MLNIDIKRTNNYKPKPNIDDSLEFGTVLYRSYVYNGLYK